MRFWSICLVFGALSMPCAAKTQVQVMTEDFPPFSYQKQGQYVGIATERVVEILTLANLDYDIHMYPWARAMHKATTEANTLIYRAIVKSGVWKITRHSAADLAPRVLHP